jgi:integrase
MGWVKGREDIMAKLTVAKLPKLPPGRHGDGDGVWFQVRPGDRRSWLFVYTSPATRRVRSMGLGPFPDVGLKAAREAGARARAAVRDGRDPLAERDTARAEAATAAATAKTAQITFSMVVGEYLQAHQAGWRSTIHRVQWENSLARLAEPLIGDLPVADISTEHILAILQPIWMTTPETASRLRGRIEAVLSYAKVRGWRSGENPAVWRGHLALTLPAKTKVCPVVHFAAMDWRALPGFMAELRHQPEITARALEWTVLTCARTSESLHARWSEVDAAAGIWIVPPARMKGGREHRVPLSAAALDVLDRTPRLADTQWLFPGQVPDRPLSPMAMTMLLRRMNQGGATVHGMRSAFRDWCAEATHHPPHVAESALAHITGDATERAYRRGDLFEKRRLLMADWAAFCVEERGRVVPFRAG